jgi:DNA-binding SARP family transcriptional activator/DNA-binding beta-propeller fold protein YncE
MALEFRLLGPLEVRRGGRQVPLRGRRQRALLALLLLHANEVVPSERLIEELFAGGSAEGPANALQAGISRLRRLLDGDGVLVTRPGGYVLEAAPEQVDVARFERLFAAGREALARGDAADAAATLREALALWRGPALADLSLLEFAQSEIRRLEELRLAALMERIEADLRLGSGSELVPELEALVAANPLQERLRGQLMLALYRADRQADALEVYRDTHKLLNDELGLEPSRALRQLQRSILEHDPSLAPASAPAPAEETLERPRRRRGPILAAAVVAAAAIVAGVLASRGGDHAPVAVRPGTIDRIDLGSNRFVESIPVGREPAGILADGRAVWVSNERDASLTRVDLHGGPSHTIGGVEKVAFLIRDSRGNVYASAWDYPFVWQIDAATQEVVQRYRVRTRALDMAVTGGSLWVVDRLANAVDRIDLARARIANMIEVGADPLVLASGYGAIWVANSDDGTVSVIRPGVRRTQTVDGILRPFGIAAGEGAVWVTSNAASTVTRIDPDTRAKTAEIKVWTDLGRSDVYDVAVGAGSVWVVNRGEHAVYRIDPRTNRVAARIELPPGAEPRTLAIDGDAVWLSVGTPGYDG